ncbi:unnamed protein product [Rotaria sordida]|uniref:Helix-turn-helix domain-containing protein n=1 Tax=Rotaria sordida TaxID=392033 RepID=A0A815NVX6_9BILA|nr:unnamed protein product [Rotaria sordida]CAF1635365.1 unnamed protein product [Rotaria sordida]
MPNFINIRLWKPGIKKSEQYKSFQRNCLIREFECRQKQARQLEKQVSSILIELEKHLSSIDYVNVKKFCYDSASRVHTKVMQTHKDKLEKLNRGPIGQNYDEMKLKLIHNISSHTLSQVEERLLCRGWDFCIENKTTNFLDFETDLELNVMKLQSHCHDSVFRSICRKIHNASQQLIRTSKHKKISNLSDEELAALKSLKSNNNIVICKADKGNCIVILDKEAYMKKADDILKGEQFEPLNNDKFHREREEELNKYIFSLFKKGVIDNKLRYQLQSTCSSISVFYGLPKVHKTGYPIRPIISTIGSYQYQLSKYLAKAIRDARPQAKSYIKDSFEFVKRIKEIVLNKEKTYIMCSFDVESLYTNVPIEEAIETTLNYIYKPTKLIDVPFDKEQMRILLNLSIRDAPFRFQNKIYKQIDGVAMVTQQEDKLITALYRKPTHTGLYMLWDSSQNRRYKLGLIKTLVIRIYRICSSKEIITKELNLLRVTLTNNGYQPHIIKRDAQQPILLSEPAYGLTINESLSIDPIITNIYRRFQIQSSTIDFIEVIHDFN